MGRVLVIDDSESARVQLEMILQQLGHDTVCAENGVLALDMLKRGETFDLIITDIFMPEMDGIEAIEKILELDGRNRILAVSAGGVGLSGGGMLEVASGLGARAVLRKPFTAEECGRVVCEIMAAA